MWLQTQICTGMAAAEIVRNIRSFEPTWTGKEWGLSKYASCLRLSLHVYCTSNLTEWPLLCCVRMSKWKLSPIGEAKHFKTFTLPDGTMQVYSYMC